jgi:hypothetical protein
LFFLVCCLCSLLAWGSVFGFGIFIMSSHLYLFSPLNMPYVWGVLLYNKLLLLKKNTNHKTKNIYGVSFLKPRTSWV